MTEKRFTAIPMTASYKDNQTGEIFAPKYEEDYYKLLNRINQISDETEELKITNESLLRCIDNIHKETLGILK